MKKKSILLVGLLFLVELIFAQTTFCLKLSEVSNDGSNLVLKIEMQGNNAFKLGSSNLQFSFSNTNVENPTLESSPLAPPFYQIPTVTNPLPRVASFNIELGFENYGTDISDASGWTEIGQVKFDVTGTGNGEFLWSYNGGTTGTVVYLDDEATQIFATADDNTCLVDLAVPLPVELLNFRAAKQVNKVKLTWQTETERNNKGFDVLRSKNGVDWESIGWLDGAGTTSVLKSYQLFDNQPLDGINYYQLNQTDLDGKSKLSEVRSINFERNKDKVSIYPNPSSNTIQITNLQPNLIESISISNEIGDVVYTATHESIIDVAFLPSGVYQVEIKTESDTFIEKFVKL